MGQYATAIRYDLSRPNTASANFHGTIPLADIGSHAQLVESVLEIEPELFDDLKRWPGMFGSGSSCVVHLVPYDARLRPSEYSEDLVENLTRHTDLAEVFSAKVDFNAKYNLNSDPLLTDEELCQIDELTACFVRLSDGKPASLSERHCSIADIQLIPQVPESVKRTFRRAKRLYVCGYFEYDFFTVSLHYALLALDAALHARWSTMLPPSVILSYHDKKAGQTHQQKMDRPSHVNIKEFSKRTGWRVASLRVDGKPFPHAVKGVIAELIGHGLMTQWQRRMIEEVYVEIRNSLTHLEFAPVHTPSPNVLERVAYLINYLFDSVPLVGPASTP